MKTIALANQKGGVGKTTTAASLGIGLSRQGKKVLLIDADAQGNLTQMLGWPQPDELSSTLSTLMEKIIAEQPITPGEGILHHPSGVHLVPANIELSALEVTLVNTMSRETVLRQYLSTVADRYDYALIDCMPSLGMLTINALTAADSVIIPVQAQYLPAKGLEQLLRTITRVKRQLNPKLEVDGIVLTMVDSRTTLAREINALVRKTYGGHVFASEIPRSIKAAEISVENKSIYDHDRSGKAALAYQLVESKQKFISQIMTSKSPVRSAEDVDEQALSYAEIKALASGNPMIKEKMDLDIEVSKLKLLKANHLSQKYALEDAISKGFPKQIAETQARIAGYGADIATVKENTHPNGDGFSPLTLAGVTHADKKEAGAALLTMCQTMLSPEATQIGSYRGLTLELAFDTFAREYRLTMIGQLRHTVTLGTDVFGNLQRMDNALEGLPIKEQTCREQLSNLQTQLETAKAEVQKPFPREAELNTKTARLEELNSLLNLDHKEPEIVDAEPDEDQRPPERRRPQLER